jgi:hypothetical protein
MIVIIVQEMSPHYPRAQRSLAMILPSLMVRHPGLLDQHLSENNYVTAKQYAR